MLAHGADRLEEPEWESGSFFFRKNKMLAEKQNAYRDTECLPIYRSLPKYRMFAGKRKTHTGKQHIYKKLNSYRDIE